MSGLRWLAGVVAGTLLAAGCSGEDPEAGPPEPRSPTTSPVATTSATAAPAPPSLPAEARRPTKAGAVAFAHHYVELINHASATGNVGGLQRAGSPRCESCRNFVKVLTEVYERGGSVEGGAWRIKSYSALQAGSKATWLVALNIAAAPQKVRDGAGAPPEQRAGGKFSASMYARWVGGGWMVKQLVRD